MKRIFALIIIFSTICLTACGNDLERVYENSVESISSDMALESVLSNVVSGTVSVNDVSATVAETPYDQLLASVCDIHEFVAKFGQSFEGNGTLNEVDESIGIECLRRDVPGCAYSIHKVKQGGLLYIFYDSSDRIIQWFYVMEDFSYCDFATIKVGSSIEDIVRIDAITQIYKNILQRDLEKVTSDNPYWSGEESVESEPVYNCECFSAHYLNDGILQIFYEYQQGIWGDNFVVARINYYDDYQWWGSLNQSRVARKDLRVFAVDRIESADDNTETPWSHMPIDERIDHSKSYTELIQNTTDFEEMINSEVFQTEFMEDDLNYTTGTLSTLDYYFPIECVRDMGNDRKYVVYRSSTDHLLYLFFDNDVYTHSVYVSTLKQKSDFDGIAVGSTFDEVVAVDEDTNYWKDREASYHLLQDGILVFTYDESGKVSGVEYSPEFIYTKTFLYEIRNQDYEYDCE